MTLPKSVKVSIYLSAGLLLIYVGLTTYICSTTKISYLINDSIKSSMPIIPSTVSEFFLFKFRGNKSDISALKKEDGGLNYIVAAIDASSLSIEKKAKYLRYFISRGCGVNEISATNGLRPLHIAAIEGKAEVVELLLENGADPTLKSEPSVIGTSMTPLEAAERSEKKNTHIDYKKVKEVLRQAEERRRHSGT